MNPELFAVVGGIVLEGMKMLSVTQQRKLHKEHKKALEEIADAQNAIFPNYTDAALDLANERMRILLEAFWSELRKANLEILQSGEGRGKVPS